MVPTLKLGLGTVEFGMEYGFPKRFSIPDPDEIKEILTLANRNGICLLDTAPCYGESEKNLSSMMPQNHNFKIITKTPIFGSLDRRINMDEVEKAFEQSLTFFGPSFYGLLAHHAEDLFSEDGELLMKKMLEFKKSGQVKKIGVSIYNSAEIDQVLERFDIDLIQIPVSIFDQRLVKKSYLEKLKKKGIEIHARSIFLQGLLFADPDRLPTDFESIGNHLRVLHSFSEEFSLSILQIAMAYVMNLNVDHVLIGVHFLHQLEEILLASNHLSQMPQEYWQFIDNIAYENEQLLNPSYWTHNA